MQLLNMQTFLSDHFYDINMQQFLFLSYAYCKKYSSFYSDDMC